MNKIYQFLSEDWKRTKEDFRKYVLPPLKIIGIVGLPIFGGLAANDIYHNRAIRQLENEETKVVEFYERRFHKGNNEKHEFDYIVAREDGEYGIHREYDIRRNVHAKSCVLFVPPERCTLPTIIIVGDKINM